METSDLITKIDLGPLEPGTKVNVTTLPHADEEREKWLEKTQPMRVVALDEANKIAIAMIQRGNTISSVQLLETAKQFADFLIDGKYR